MLHGQQACEHSVHSHKSENRRTRSYIAATSFAAFHFRGARRYGAVDGAKNGRLRIWRDFRNVQGFSVCSSGPLRLRLGFVTLSPATVLAWGVRWKGRPAMAPTTVPVARPEYGRESNLYRLQDQSQNRHNPEIPD